MPVLTIYTNVGKEKIGASFLKDTTTLVADVLHKPAAFVVVHVIPDQLMMWGGSSDPCANVHLGSIGSLGKDQNKKISKKLSKHLKEQLGLPANRMYIQFADLERANVGYEGTTFDDL